MSLGSRPAAHRSIRAVDRLADQAASLIGAGGHTFRLDGAGVYFDGRTGFPVPVSPALLNLLERCLQGEDPRQAALRTGDGRAAEMRREFESWRQVGLLTPGPRQGVETPRPTGILSALLNVTHRCNLACDYCLMAHPALHDGYGRRDETMDPETARRAVDYLARHGIQKGINLCFFGGEPLLAFRLIEQTVAYAEAAHPGRFRYSMITNGTVVNDCIIRFLGKHRVGLIFSIDGDRESNDRLRKFRAGEGSVFDAAFSAYREMRRREPHLACKVNITYFHPTVNLARGVSALLEQGVSHLRFERGLAEAGSPMALTDADVEAIQAELVKVARDYGARLAGGQGIVIDNFVTYMKKLSDRIPRTRGCNLGIDYVAIAPGGEVYACHKLVGMAGAALGRVDDVHTPGPWEAVWDCDVDHRPMCRDCWARYACGGHCVTENLHANGDALRPRPDQCAIVRRTVELSAWLLARLERKRPSALRRVLGPSYVGLRDRPVRTDAERLDFALNESAAELLADCDGRRTVAELARRFGARYGLAPSPARLVVRETLARFRREGLVDAADADRESVFP